MENLNKVERKVGAKGFYGQFPATVRRICEWSDSLVEVRVPGGEICVSIYEITKAPRTADYVNEEA